MTGLPNSYPSSSQIRHGEGTVAEALGSAVGQTTVASISALRLLTLLSGYVRVLSTAEGGSANCGIYKWDSASIMQDNGDTIVQPSSTPASGRWVLNSPVVTGSRGANAALASLLTALDQLGIIQNNTAI